MPPAIPVLTAIGAGITAAAPAITAATAVGGLALGVEAERRAKSEAADIAAAAARQEKKQEEEAEKLRTLLTKPTAIAKRETREMRRRRTRTIFTGPRGLETTAPVARKTLLGE